MQLPRRFVRTEESVAVNTGTGAPLDVAAMGCATVSQRGLGEMAVSTRGPSGPLGEFQALLVLVCVGS